MVEHRGRHGAVGIAVEADELPGHRAGRQPIGHVAHRDRVGQLHARRVRGDRGRRGEQPAEAVAGADGLQLGRAGGQHDLVGVGVHELDPPVVVRHPHDERRAVVDGHDLLAVSGVEHEHVPTLGSERGELGPAALALADHGDVDRPVPHGRRRPVAAGVAAEERRPADLGVPAHHHAVARRRLARADVGHPVDLGDAAPAVAGQAQRPAVAGVLPGPQDGERDRVAGRDRQRRTVQLQGRHVRIRRPCGSNAGSGCRWAGQRWPMISTSKPP